MKFIVQVAFAMFVVCQLSAAANCTSGTLSSYISLGSGGCTISGDNLSDFQLIGGTTGATEIPPASVLLSPSGSAANPTLTASFAVTSPAGTVQESLFTYQLSGASYNNSVVTLSNSSETGDGAVTGLENFCAGGSFGSDGVSGCSAHSGALATVDGAQNQDSATFAASNLVSVTTDLTVDGGTSGSATGANFVEQFGTASTSATPEPGSVLLMCTGLACLAGLRSRLKQ